MAAVSISPKRTCSVRGSMEIGPNCCWANQFAQFVGWGGVGFSLGEANQFAQFVGWTHTYIPALPAFGFSLGESSLLPASALCVWTHVFHTLGFHIQVTDSY